MWVEGAYSSYRTKNPRQDWMLGYDALTFVDAMCLILLTGHVEQVTTTQYLRSRTHPLYPIQFETKC